jgi:glycosyltransferase involved in cell wall biosynthesis
MNTSKYKISCLTVTLDRLDLLKKSIQCFCDQTYLSKELVIVSDGKKEFKNAVRDHVHALERKDIKLVFLEASHYTLGMLRNISMEAAEGDIICQWDDDDMYHPERLACQVECMLRKQAQACFLTDQLCYFSVSNKLYWVDWCSGGQRNSIIPGTMMMFKKKQIRYPESGAFAKAGEDTIFFNKINISMKIARLSNCGYLYVYTYHGKNTYQQQHHMRLIKEFGCLPHTAALECDLRTAISYYSLETPYYVQMKKKKVAFPEKETIFTTLSRQFVHKFL